jgi:hypothetical protein
LSLPSHREISSASARRAVCLAADFVTAMA